MSAHKVYAMSFAKVYPCYVQKAEGKGRTQAEVDEIIHWLTGYDDGLKAVLDADSDVETSFEAPRLILCGTRSRAWFRGARRGSRRRPDAGNSLS